MASSLDKFMRDEAARAVDVPVLQCMSRGEALPLLWATYLRERFRIVHSPPEEMGDLELLLEELMLLADRTGDVEMKQVIERNLNDERGVRGELVKEEWAHASWRADFRAAFQALLVERGVPAAAFRGAFTPETLVHKAFMSEAVSLVRAGGLFEGMAVLCALEGAIREEFSLVARGLTLSFPELTEVQRHYIDDHAMHDEGHYLMARKALEDALLVLEDGDRAQEEATVRRMVGATTAVKRGFFEGLALKPRLLK